MSPGRKQTTERAHWNPNHKPKRAFASLSEAKRFARKQSGSNRRPYQAYQCPVCLGFHIGRKPASQAGKRRVVKFKRAVAEKIGALQ